MENKDKGEKNAVDLSGSSMFVERPLSFEGRLCFELDVSVHCAQSLVRSGYVSVDSLYGVSHADIVRALQGLYSQESAVAEVANHIYDRVQWIEGSEKQGDFFEVLDEEADALGVWFNRPDTKLDCMQPAYELADNMMSSGDFLHDRDDRCLFGLQSEEKRPSKRQFYMDLDCIEPFSSDPNDVAYPPRERAKPEGFREAFFQEASCSLRSFGLASPKLSPVPDKESEPEKCGDDGHDVFAFLR